jgi:tetratricopeptide (TPR) repeat protein
MSRARAYALVGAVTLAASLTSLRNGFVYDDVPAVAHDPRIRSLAHLPSLLTAPYWQRDMRDRLYRPITTASFAIDWAVGGGRPLVFHATNIGLHVLVALLVLALARAVLGAGAGALVATLWFAVHPVHVEAVANVVGRAELLAAAGFLGATLAYLAEGAAAAREPHGARRALLAALCLLTAAAAYGSKEHSLTLPAALLLADAWAARRAGESLLGRWRRHRVTWLGTLVLAAGYLALRGAVLGTVFGGGSVAAGLEHLGAGERAFAMLPAILVWARLLVWPWHLSVDYSPDAYVPAAHPGAAHLAGVLLLAGVVLAAWRLWRAAPGAAFGLGWFAIAMAVAANVVVPTGVVLAERVMYLGSVGAAVAAGALWELLPRTRAVWIATALVLTTLAARALARVPVWRDEEGFYQSLVRDAPESYRSWWAMGARAFAAGRANKGEAAYRRSIAIYPDPAAMQELGERYLAAGLFAPADVMLSAAWRADSLRADAAVEAVLARLKLGRDAAAVRLGEEALRHFPGSTSLLLEVAQAYQALGRPLSALALSRRAVVASPGAWQPQQLAARAAALAGRCEEARWRVARAVALAPADPAPRALAASLRDGPRCGLEP